MLIDRNDSTINLCEIKYSESEFTIDKKYEHELRSHIYTAQRGHITDKFL